MKLFSAPRWLISVVIGLLTLTISAFGADPSHGTLKGSVADTVEHARITRAYILVHQPGGEDRRVSVDEHGYFSIELQPGIYDVFVSSVGFGPACQQVRIDVSKTTISNIYLKASKFLEE